MGFLSTETGRKVLELSFKPDEFQRASLDPLLEACRHEGLVLQEDAITFGLDILAYEIQERLQKGEVQQEIRAMLVVDEAGWGFLIEVDGISPFGAFYRYGEILPLFYGHIFF